MIRRSWSVSLSAVVLCVVGAGCGAATTAPQTQAPAAAGAGHQPKRIIAAVAGDLPVVFRNVLASPSGVPGSDAVDELVNGGLAVRDNTSQYRPELAVALPTLITGSGRFSRMVEWR